MSFDKKRAKLNQVKATLKQKFVGIDDIIDIIIQKITNWYLMPYVQTRPLVINLWGLTGVGKTDLVRELVKALDFQDFFVEMPFSPGGTCARGGNDSYESHTPRPKCFSEYIDTTLLKPNYPGVLLLDEFQNFQTIDSYGENIINDSSDKNLNDLWTFLSDGMVQPRISAAADLEFAIYDTMFDKDRKGIYDSDRTRKVEQECVYVHSPYEAYEIKRMLQLPDSIIDIMKFTTEDILQKSQEARENKQILQPKNFQQLLVFVSGNLNDAYKSVGSLYDADQDADSIYDRTKQINILHIKEALSRKFKPEQISRLGNIHIIYPSLTKAAYKKLIDMRTFQMLSNLKSKINANCEIQITQKLKDLMYNNGVFPTQGVRPLFTTIDDILNACLPEAVLQALDTKSQSVIIDYNNKIVIEATKEDNTKVHVNVPFVGPLDIIRDKLDQNQDYKAVIAVHEAGHALLHALLYGVAPSFVSLTPASLESEGITYLHDHDHEYVNIFKNIEICYGGKLAERIIFDTNFFGSSSDLQHATDLAARLIRYEGLDGFYNLSEEYRELFSFENSNFSNSPTFKPSIKSNSEALVNVKATDGLIETICQLLHDKAYDRISEHEGVLREFSKEIFKQKHMNAKQVQTFLKKHNINVTIKDTTGIITGDFYGKLFTE